MNSIPDFGMGTYKIQGDKCSDIIYNGLKCGFRSIDTAELYNNQIDIKNGINRAIDDGICNRDDLWITSKIHNKDQRKLNIGPSIEKIMLDIGVDSIELIILHSAQKNYIEAYTELIHCQNHFNVKYIGVSNFRIDELKTIIDKTNIKPYLNQIEITPFNKRVNLRTFCKEQNINIQAYSPLTCTKGFGHSNLINDEFSPDELLLKWSIYNDLKPIPTSDTIEFIHKNYNSLTTKFDSSHLDLIHKIDSINDEIINYRQHSDK